VAYRTSSGFPVQAQGTGVDDAALPRWRHRGWAAAKLSVDAAYW